MEAVERRALRNEQTKFENVHKYYYKRRKDSRAGRNDGKKLGALHGTAGAASPVAPPARAVAVPGMVGPSTDRALAEPPHVGATGGMATPVVGGNLSFSTSNTEDYSDDEGTDDMGGRVKRKRTSVPPPSSQTHATPTACATTPPPSSQPPASTQSQKPTASGSGGGVWASSSSRWPKAEVLALIQLRSNLDMRQKERRGTLWEEISAGMRRMGYSRSSKQCNKKWENMKNYFKKVKERPEYSRTWPYFHHIEALYRTKAALRSPSGGGGAAAEHVNAAPQERIKRRRNGPKAPLWEEISTGMGYSWSSKQCMDKWRNMTIKKAKDINKTRPDDCKTCPSYLHQLEALYGNKAAIGSTAGDGGAASVHANAVPQDCLEAAPISQTAMKSHTLPPVSKNGMTKNYGNGHDVGGVSGGTQMQASNGGSVAGNRFVFSKKSSMDLLNDLPELPVRSSTISIGAEVEEFLMGFTDVVA